MTRLAAWHCAVGALAALLASIAIAEHALFAPFDPPAPGQGALLALRALIVAAVALAARERAHGSWMVLAVAALFFFSLVVPGSVLVLVIVGVAALIALPAPPIDLPRIDARVLVSTGAAIVVLALAAWTLRPLASSRPHLPLATDPPRESAIAWRGAGNLYRARWSALAWARSEANDPGEGYLFLATIDLELGFADKAHKTLEKVVARSSSADSRRRAAELLSGTNP